MTLRLVAFDLGGVLVDVDRASLTRRLAPSIVGGAAAVDAAFFSGALHDDLSTGAIDGDAFVAEVSRRLSARADVVRAAWEGFVDAAPGADALVRALPLPCVPWSNTDPIHFARIARALPELCGAPARGLSFELGAMKPDPSFYERALRRADVAAHEVLFLDDREENVAAACALGVDARCARGVDDARRVLAAALLFA